MKRVLGLAVSVGFVALFSACQQSGGPLKVDTVEPPQGTTAGGDEITIVGGGFQPGKTQAQVTMGGKKVETVIIASADKIKVMTPAHEKGPVDVRVMFDDGAAFEVKNAFRFVEPAANDNARRAFFGGGQKPGEKIEIEKKAQ
jgi:IPT/TIG domain